LKRYLLDTNICIFYLKGKFNLDKKLEQVAAENCFISEITLAELKFGAANSSQVDKNQQIIANFQLSIQVLPIFSALDFYAKEKSRLRKLGTPLDDFDLLIGATAVVNELVMVTNNTSHFARMNLIELEDWTAVIK